MNISISGPVTGGSARTDITAEHYGTAPTVVIVRTIDSSLTGGTFDLASECVFRLSDWVPSRDQIGRAMRVMKARNLSSEELTRRFVEALIADGDDFHPKAL
ncbi:MAG: hypothetical protein ACLQVD_06430 [Capsulimonadaceae bacterium]